MPDFTREELVELHVTLQDRIEFLRSTWISEIKAAEAYITKLEAIDDKVLELIKAAE